MLIQLAAGGARIILEGHGDTAWTQVYVSWPDRVHKAGADSLEVVVAGLLAALHPEDLPNSGRLLDNEVGAALTLSEKNTTLYASHWLGGIRMIWQSSLAQVVGTIEIDASERELWERRLISIAATGT